MNNREILNRSKKILTNKFTGMEKENVSNAIMNKFQFKIKNNTGATRKLAIVPGYMSTIGFSVEKTHTDVVKYVNIHSDSFVKQVDFVGEKTETGLVVEELGIDMSRGVTDFEINMHRHSTKALSDAGYPVDVVLDDATVRLQDKDFVMQSANPSKKIADFLDYIKTNPILLKEMTIISTDKSAFSTDMEVAILDPFKRNPEQLIDMNQFYSKYQFAEDRIDLRFDKGELELSDVLLWTMNVPADAEMSIILRF